MPVDRAQAEIDAGLGREALRRERQRVERGHHAVLHVAVEREIAALLDQRAGQRLDERPLGQPQLMRRRAALVVGLVAGGERHHHVDAGPGMLGQILDGLADAVLGARLRQHQREVGRAVERTRRLGGRLRRGLLLEHRLRVDHAVVVLDLVGKLQRAAGLAFRLLGERDDRHAVRDRGEAPHQIVAAAAHGRAAVVGDGVAKLLRAGRRLRPRVAALQLGNATRDGDVDIGLAGRAHHQRRAGGDGNGGEIAHRLAGTQPRQNLRRPAGVGRRRHPRVDAEVGRRHHALPVERRGDALGALAAGGEEGRDHEDEHQRAQRIRIARRKLWQRRSGAQGAGGAQRALHVGAPQRRRERIVGFRNQVVGDRGGRAVRQVAGAVEPAQAVIRAGQPHQEQRHRRGDREDEEHEQADGAAKRRQRDPQSQPGDGEEQARGGGDRSQRRPQPLPQDRPAGARQGARQHAAALLGAVVGAVRGRLGHKVSGPENPV